MAADELMPTIQAAEYLGIRPLTLRHWICDGKIDFVKYAEQPGHQRVLLIDKVSKAPMKIVQLVVVPAQLLPEALVVVFRGKTSESSPP